MAVTIVQAGQFKHREVYTVTITADGDADLALPDQPIAGVSIQSDGTDGGGTLTVLVSNDLTNYVAAGFATAVAPKTDVAASATASGAWVLDPAVALFRGLRFHLTGSTSPTLVLTIVVAFR